MTIKRKMKVYLELYHTTNARSPRQSMDREIAAVQRAIDGKPTCCDDVPLISVRSILEAIREQLPEETP